MPRKARSVFKGYPHHVLYLARSGVTLFHDDEDYTQFLSDLRNLSQQHGVSVHGWCLLDQAVHLVITPHASASGISQFMKAMAGNATRHHNSRHGSKGTIWNDRFHSSLIQPHVWELATLRYLETLPVRRRLAPSPSKYRWSSYPSRMKRDNQGWPADSSEYTSLGDTPESRRELYRTFCKQPIDDHEVRHITDAIQRNEVTGDPTFLDEVKKQNETKNGCPTGKDEK